MTHEQKKIYSASTGRTVHKLPLNFQVCFKKRNPKELKISIPLYRMVSSNFPF